MTISSFMGLQTALRGLEATQEAIDTTGHNIANANTPGYSRQAAVFTESPALTIPANSNVDGAGVQLGTGVDVTTINRIRNQFLDIQYRAQNTAENNASTQSTILDQVQTGLAEPTSNGLSAAMSAFWNSWSDLANNTTSTAAQKSVINAGATVAQTFSTIDQQLSTVQSQVSQQYAALTAPNGQVMSDANQIADLNGSIASSQAAGQNPNDLMDQRDQLIDDLSSLATVVVDPQTNGMVNVTFGDQSNGPLVNGTTPPQPPVGLTATVPGHPGAGGQIGALLSLDNQGVGQIQAYRTTLDNVAGSLANSVNALLPAATPFFTGNTSGTIGVVAKTTDLQASVTNSVAMRIAGLSDTPVVPGTPTIGDQYATFIAQVGSDAQSVQNTQQTAESLLGAIGNQRQSISGVSLDEEMTNLISFQRGYQASARMMTTIDGMLDTLINHTGTVGL